jgi:hypothetical protein
MTKNLNKLFWHDGNFFDFAVSVNEKGQTLAQLKVLLYKNEGAAAREMYQIQCENVLSLVTAIDTKELKSNAFAGNIFHGYFEKKTLCIHLFGGILEIETEKIRTKKCK